MAANDCVNCNDKTKNPGSPEFQKPWKPENNSGCGCNIGGGDDEEEADPITRTVRQSFTRGDFL